MYLVSRGNLPGQSTITVKQTGVTWRFYADLETSDRAHFLLWPSQLISLVFSFQISAWNAQWSPETDLSLRSSGQWPQKCDKNLSLRFMIFVKK